MKKIGIITYNMYGNFTNYGSALQSYALFRTIKKIGMYEPVLVDYCPDCLKNKDPLNPIKNLWDKDDESKKMCELSMPAIKVNYYKFLDFYHKRFQLTDNKYDSHSFNKVTDEGIYYFICGSDTIFCIDEFGFDPGYFADFDVMKRHTISYAASFGDAKFNKKDDKDKLINLLTNFNGIGLRENIYIEELRKRLATTICRVLDPTLLLKPEEYDEIISPVKYSKKYILLYARRYNQRMEEYAESLAKKTGYEIIEISLRATNSKKHKMFYEAGVEEFLYLVKNAEYVVTNSFHGIIFAIQFKKDFFAFSREQCSNKISELLDLFDLSDRLLINGNERFKDIDYNHVQKIIDDKRRESLSFLKKQISNMIGD